MGFAAQQKINKKSTVIWIVAALGPSARRDVCTARLEQGCARNRIAAPFRKSPFWLTG